MYTTKQLYEIARMASTRVHNFEEFFDLFSFFWNNVEQAKKDVPVILYFLGYR